MCEFTKGKWKYEESENNPINGTWYQITDEEGLIAICTRDNDFARFIAAAPEMFHLLSCCYEIVPNYYEKKIGELLERITGEEA